MTGPVRVAVVLLAALTVGFWPVSASAHTDFESSAPADGAVVDRPVPEVVVNFTNPARPAGNGFELLDPSGQIRRPSSIDPTDGTTFVLTFDPPLTAGTYGLRWQVQAGDAHPKTGSFSFSVAEAATTTVAAATTTTMATTTTTTTVASTAAPSTTEAGTRTSPDTTTIEVSPAPPAPTESSAALDDFLAGGDSTDDGATLGRIGRILTALGLIIGLGTFTALLWVIRGDRRELATLVRAVRFAGLVIIAGGLFELTALAASQSLPVVDLLDTEAGSATMLKIVGGLVVLAAFGRRAGRHIAPPRALSAAVRTDNVTDAVSGHGAVERGRWAPTRSAWLGVAGFVVVVMSYWFDGHTVSRGPRVLHAAVNSIHLSAAAVWGGGVFAMTMIVWVRRRAAAPTDLGLMIVRFSTPATVSLIAVFAAGLAMGAIILDQPDELLDSDWGRLLAAKTTAVAIVTGLGAFNHFRLRPALEQRPDDPDLARKLRVSLTVESAMFLVIIGLTAWLVAAAT